MVSDSARRRDWDVRCELGRMVERGWDSGD